MNKLTDWIKRYPVVAFFIIAFTFTRGLGFSYDAVLNKGKVYLFPLVAVATCGPELSRMVENKSCYPERHTSTVALQLRGVPAYIPGILPMESSSFLLGKYD